MNYKYFKNIIAKIKQMKKRDIKKLHEGVSTEGLTQKGAKNPFVEKPIKLPLKLIKFRKNYYIITREGIEDVFSGSVPSSNIFNTCLEHGGIYLATRLKDNVIQYIFPDDKGLKYIKEDTKKYKEILNKYFPSNWKEEFESNLYQYCHSEYILNLLHKYSVDNKVKIKARKGCIQIERMD